MNLVVIRFRLDPGDGLDPDAYRCFPASFLAIGQSSKQHSGSAGEQPVEDVLALLAIGHEGTFSHCMQLG